MSKETDSLKLQVEMARKKEESISSVLRFIPVRSVLWVLIVALGWLTLHIGNGMIARLDALELWKKEQNGHIKKIDETLIKISTDLEWVRHSMEKK